MAVHSLPETADSWPESVEIGLDVLSAALAGPAAIASRQRTRLHRLLLAARRTRFYRDALGGLPLDRLTLDALPVTGKREMMAAFADRVADSRITLEGLREFCADPLKAGRPYLDRYRVWESSGSTGEPGIFVQDATAMAVYDVLEGSRRYSPRPLARLIDPFYLGERFAFVGAIGGHFASYVSMRRLWETNPWLASRSRSLSILRPTAALVADLNAFGPSILATYPTAAVMLAEEALAGRLRIAPFEIWTGGENLSASMRAQIEQGLGGEVCNSYGASEFLPLAWECGHRRLHVNADWVILEAVDADHRPVPPGTVSHTTLLTNLANHVQPLIRFDIGDRILFDERPCPCGSSLPTVQVQGRRDDVLIEHDRRGGPVHLLPLALTTLLEDDVGVFDFQLCQTRVGRWTLTLGPGASGDPTVKDRCRQHLARYCRLQGALAPRIDVQGAVTLPLGRSGKLKRISSQADQAESGQ